VTSGAQASFAASNSGVGEPSTTITSARFDNHARYAVSSTSGAPEPPVRRIGSTYEMDCQMDWSRRGGTSAAPSASSTGARITTLALRCVRVPSDIVLRVAGGLHPDAVTPGSGVALESVRTIHRIARLGLVSQLPLP